jgi:D-3-phosphoglycerate dehydrogenase
MKSPLPVAVCSRSFSRHPVLRAALLERYEKVTFNDQGLSFKGAELIAYLRGHAKAIVGLEPIDDAVLAAVPELQVVGKYGVGMDMLDLPAFERRGVLLGWVPGVNKRSVAELVLAFALALMHRVPTASHTVRSGGWKPEVGRELTGSTVGLVGFGHVARDVATLLTSFDCRLLVHDVAVSSEVFERYRAIPVALDALLAESDVVSLHVPLNDSTRGLLNAQRLSLMKMGAILINTARGHVVDEAALESALRAGRLSGAGFDVFASEPPSNADLLRLPNFLGTPHMASSTEQGIIAMGQAAIYGLDHAMVPSALGLV